MSKGLASVKTLTAKEIADKFNLPLATVVKKIAAGVKVEKEHTKSTRQANEIARDHLGERPDYYDKLHKMEKTKVVKEMDTSSMPMSKNIEDRRSPEGKADDAKIKPGEDIGGPSGDGPSRSWMKGAKDYGTPTKPDYGYDISTTRNYKAPEQKEPFKNDTDSLTPHQRLDKSYWSEPVKGIINKPRLKISEETTTTGIGGLGFRTGTPAIDDDNGYVSTNALAYDPLNGARLDFIKKIHSKLHKSLGFNEFNPTNKKHSNSELAEAKLNELGEYDNKGGMSGYEDVSGPIRAIRKNEMEERALSERGKVPADMTAAAERGIFEISAELVGKVSNARFFRGEAPSKTLNRAIIKKFIESGKKKEEPKTVKEETKMDNKELINEALDCILEDNLPEMKDNLMLALQEKAMEKLEERKKEIAANYFAQ